MQTQTVPRCTAFCLFWIQKRGYPNPDKPENCHQDSKAQRKVFLNIPLCLGGLVAKYFAIKCKESIYNVLKIEDKKRG
jgi:hypothetical protein